MVWPTGTLFYDYDLFLKEIDKFKELFTKVSTVDPIHLAVFMKPLERNCLVWKFTAELDGEYSCKDLTAMLNHKHLCVDFLYDFQCNDKATFMDILPLKDLFTLESPYLSVAAFYQKDTKQFYFSKEKVTFSCGMIVNNDIRNKIATQVTVQYAHKTHNLIAARGGYAISILDEEQQKKQMEWRLKAFLPRMKIWEQK